MDLTQNLFGTQCVEAALRPCPPVLILWHVLLPVETIFTYLVANDALVPPTNEILDLTAQLPLVLLTRSN